MLDTVDLTFVSRKLEDEVGASAGLAQLVDAELYQSLRRGNMAMSVLKSRS